MVSISEGQALRRDSGQGQQFRRPEPAGYRKILQQTGRIGDDFCIPPRRGRWLLSQPGGSKFANENRSKSVYNAG